MMRLWKLPRLMTWDGQTWQPMETPEPQEFLVWSKDPPGSEAVQICEACEVNPVMDGSCFCFDCARLSS